MSQDLLRHLGVKEIGVTKEIVRVIGEFIDEHELSDFFVVDPYSEPPTEDIPEFVKSHDSRASFLF